MSTQDRPLLTAIIVAYNSEDAISETVQHLEEVTACLDVEIVVIDNGSSDRSAERAGQALRRGEVIRSSENLGFGGGVNLGLRAASGTYALIMNDDVWPQTECIEQMLDVVSSETVGLVGPRMTNSDGQPSFAVRSHLPGMRDEIARISNFLRGLNTRTSYPSGQQPIEVEMLICACVIGRTDVLRELGGFNSSFFMYGEDLDLGRRLKSANLKLMTVPGATAVHERGISPDRRFRGHEFSERILNARDLYYRIWLPRHERIAVNLLRAMGLSDQPYRFKYHLSRALWDGPSLTGLRNIEPLKSQS